MPAQRMKLLACVKLPLLLICLAMQSSAAQLAASAASPPPPYGIAIGRVYGELYGTCALTTPASALVPNYASCKEALNKLHPKADGTQWSVTNETDSTYPRGCYVHTTSDTQQEVAYFNKAAYTAPKVSTEYCTDQNRCICTNGVAASSIATVHVNSTSQINCEQSNLHSILRADVCAAAATKKLGRAIAVADVTVEDVNNVPYGCYIGTGKKVWLNKHNAADPHKKCNNGLSTGCLCAEPHKAYVPTETCNTANSCALQGKVDNDATTESRSCLVSPPSSLCTAWAAANPTLMTSASCARGCKDIVASKMSAAQMEKVYVTKFSSKCT